MSKPFEFSDFVEEFRVPFTYLMHENGFWNDEGDYVEPVETPIHMSGIVLPLSENDLKYSEAGTYSEKDKKLYTVRPLELNRQVIYRNDVYTVQNFKDYSEYADVYIYLARHKGKVGEEP